MIFEETYKIMWATFSKEFGIPHNNALYFKNINSPRYHYAKEIFLELEWIKPVEEEDKSSFDFIANNTLLISLMLLYANTSIYA